MGDTVKALIAIYAALGGEESTANVNTIPEALTLIASQVATATAPELPEVSASDNGKVLKVIDGEWAVGSDDVE